MSATLYLNVALLRRRVPNITVAARNVGLRPATVSNLCSGTTRLAKANVGTLVALAELADCSLDELIMRRGGEMLETGIKVIDLFAPVVRGGRVGVIARQGMGQVVLLQELVQRFNQREAATVVWLPEGAHPFMRQAAEAADAVGTSVATMQRHVAELGQSGDVLVGADRGVVMSRDLDRLQNDLEQTAAPVTYVLVDGLGESPDEDLPYGPLDTVWALDADLAARKYFPALNPMESTSTLLEGDYLDGTHLTVEKRGRKLLRRYRDLHALVRVQGSERLAERELEVYRRGQRLEAFLTQPFFTVEGFSNRPGEWVDVAQTIEDVRRIVDGAADGVVPEDLLYRGRLS